MDKKGKRLKIFLCVLSAIQIVAVILINFQALLLKNIATALMLVVVALIFAYIIGDIAKK